jgi:tetratricopeptide (TPR) repeat protein
MACFFLTPIFFVGAQEKSWHFDPQLETIYKMVINLQTDEAHVHLNKINDKDRELYKLYVQSLNETIEVLFTEDLAKYNELEKRFKARSRLLESRPESAETIFLQAEMSLQRGFNLLNLGQELNAVLAFRNAYQMAQDCLKKYPHFIPIKKTNGVLQVMVGSVPDKYHWFMSLLGMKGSVKIGQKQLDELRTSPVSLNLEATILYYVVKGLVNQQFDEGAKGLSEKLKTDPNNRLVIALVVNLMMKNAQSEEAYKYIQQLEAQKSGLQMPYMEYLKGEILMQQNKYDEAIVAYQKFIKAYKADSFKKDAYLKISLCYYLSGRITMAKTFWEKAKQTGNTKADPDVYADAMLSDKPFPNEKILKTRLYTDGGYYKEAKAMFQTIQLKDLKTYKEQVEYYYRKARLAHKTNDLNAAKLFYQQSMDMTGDNPWYFGASSALQMGYIFMAAHDTKKAKLYFEKALSYKKHEYKNSIDSKAKSGLEEVEGKK